MYALPQQLWDLDNGDVIRTFDDHNSQISCLQWHPTNPHLFLSTSINGSAFQWDKRVAGVHVVEFKLPDKTPPWILSVGQILVGF
jgi:WD40 repeat protein